MRDGGHHGVALQCGVPPSPYTATGMKRGMAAGEVGPEPLLATPLPMLKTGGHPPFETP